MLTVAQEVLDNKVYPKQPGLLSTFRYFLRGTAVVLMGKCMCVYVRVCVRVHVSPIGFYVCTQPVCVCFCAYYRDFFSWGFRANRAGLFVVIHEIALGLHAIGSSNSLTFFPTFLFLLVMDWGGGLVRWAQIQHHTVFTSGLPRSHPTAPSRPLFSFLSQT